MVAPEGLHGILITFQSQTLEPIRLMHSNQEVIQYWLKDLRQQADSLAFEDLYEKGHKLGRGKFASVYLCKHKGSGQLYAVK